MSNSLTKKNGLSQSKSSLIEENKRKMATIFGLASIYGGQVDENATDLWLSVLRDFSATQVEKAGERLVKTEELVKMPAPAVLIRHIKEIEDERIREQSRIKNETCKKLEEAKKELKETYRKKFNKIYDLCFCKRIDGNEYQRRSDALYVELRKELNKIEVEYKSIVLGLTHGEG